MSAEGSQEASVAGQALLLRISGQGYEEIAAALKLENAEAARQAVQAGVLGRLPDTQELAGALKEHRLRAMLLALWTKASSGNQQAAAQALDIMDRLEQLEKQAQAKADAFPASILTPGQEESRGAHARLSAINQAYPGKIPWWEAYEYLRETGWDWRKAAFIAWSVLPLGKRWPRTIEELATGVLGLHSARVIRKWRQNDPNIDLAIEKVRMMTMGDHLADVLDAWVTVASSYDPAAHRDRITYLETMGVYKNKSALELSGEGGGPIRTQKENELEDLSDDDLGWLIRNLEAAAGIAGAGAD